MEPWLEQQLPTIGMKMKLSNIVFTVIFIVLINIPGYLMISCVDDDNNIVDWIFLYKLPALSHKNQLITNGLAYIFMSSRDFSWKLSDNSINSTHSLIAKSLNSMYSSIDAYYVLYNDEPPYGNEKPKGHNKGVVLMYNSSGLWLIHSVPKFPSLNVYNFPESGKRYGQSFLCISTDMQNIDKIGLQLQYNEPQIYAQNIPSTMRNELPNLYAAAANITVKQPPWFHQLQIVSSSGYNFLSFSKSKDFGKDLYEDWLAPALQTNLLVETWPNGPGRLNSNCERTFKVKNIKSIHMSALNVSFTSTHDHSKWAISSDGSNHWICVGDLNRAEHQEKRGGGTVCIEDEKLSKSYNDLVYQIEECSDH